MLLKNWLKFSIIWFLTIILIIISITFIPILNKQIIILKKEIINSLSVNNLKPNPLEILHVNNIFNILNFLLSYGSFKAIFSLNGFILFKFWSINLYIFIPIFIFFSLITIVFVFYLLINKKTAYWKLKIHFLFIKWFVVINSIILYFSLFLGLFLIAVVDNFQFILKEKIYWYNLVNKKELVTWINNVQYKPNAFSILGLIINQNTLKFFFLNAPIILQIGAVLIIFITPFVGINFAIGMSILIAIKLKLLSNNYYYDSLIDFIKWLGFVNISSKREFFQRLKSNVGMILLMIGFIIIIIFPAFTIINNSILNLFILSITIILMIISFIPIYFMLFCLINLKKNSYNLWMFIQMIVWLIIGLIWQILIWTIFKYNLKYSVIILIFTIYFFINVLLISFYLLIRGYRK